MFYLEYEKDTRLVIKIHEIRPETVPQNHDIATSDNFPVDMEMEFVITVDSVDQDGNVTASTTSKQVMPAHQLLIKINELQVENSSMKSSLADLWEVQLFGGAE